MDDQKMVRVKALTPFNHGTHDAKKGDEIEVSEHDAEELYKRKLIERVPREPAGATEQGKDGSGIISTGSFDTKAAPPHENK